MRGNYYYKSEIKNFKKRKMEGPSVYVNIRVRNKFGTIDHFLHQVYRKEILPFCIDTASKINKIKSSKIN